CRIRPFYWDFIELEEAYPTKESPVIESLKKEGSTISFNWWGNYSNKYLVWYSDNMSDWFLADPPGEAGFIGEDWPINFSDTITPSIWRHFYRVEERRY
ncbi:unnamed protein product, partial [marine sediment metagenome]